jgi:hypothetical protein
MDKTSLSIVTLSEQGDEREFWLTRTPEQRWLAIEQMRQIVYGYQSATERLQRLLEVAQFETR